MTTSRIFTPQKLVTLVAGGVIGMGISLAPQVLADKEPVETAKLPWEEARLLVEVLERVQHDYVDSVEATELIEGAIRGMVSQLDPHSSFLDSDEYREIRISTTGNYSGIGLQVNVVDGLVRVISPIDGTPAYEAGFQSGDTIVSVDDEVVERDSLDETVTKMRGPAGSAVALEVRREGVDELLRFQLNRETIRVASVKGELLEPGYGYARITQFSETTGRDLVKTMHELIDTNEVPLDGLVLDLRNNPGGVLDAAVDVSDSFLDSGLIVSADGRVDDARFSMEAHPGDLMEGRPIVVLVNAGSASASEIVAGALKDHDRALVMGTKTYGKGSVQTVMPLSSGRAIKLTTSRYYTPSGESIHEVGIKPDVVVRLSPEELEALGNEPDIDALPRMQRDKALREALDHLKSQREQRIVKSSGAP